MHGLLWVVCMAGTGPGTQLERQHCQAASDSWHEYHVLRKRLNVQQRQAEAWPAWSLQQARFMPFSVVIQEAWSCLVSLECLNVFVLSWGVARML